MKRRPRNRAGGFTFIELMIVLSIMLVVALVTMPPLLNFVARSKTLGAATQLSSLFRLARAQAVKRNVTVVVKALGVDTGEGQAGEVFAFADANNDGVWNEPTAAESRFDQDGIKLQGSFLLAQGMLFAGPGTAANGNATAFSGFQTASGGRVGIVRFLPSGAVVQIGAFRLRDNRNNILEVRIDQQTTGRVSLRKYEGDPAAGTDDLTLYYNQGATTWNWH